MTECTKCHKDYKNLSVHQRFCKVETSQSPDPSGEPILKSNSILSVPPSISHSPDVDNYRKHFWQFWKKKKPKTNKFPEKLLSTQGIKDIKLNNPVVLTDEQKFLRFFGNLPKWTEYKPGWLATKIAKMKTKADFTIKSCIFVDDEGENKRCWIPYNTQLGLLFTDNGFYDMPIKDTEPIFLDKNKFSPLVNRKNYRDDFDIPEDLAASLVNTGVGYGQLDKFKELIAKIEQLKYVTYAAIIMVIVVVIAIAYINYAQGEHYKILATAVNNVTRGN